MEYSINALAKIAKTSTRTLRYYDSLGILKPARINSSGYRIYSQIEVDRLQQILFYKELGFSLQETAEALASPDFDPLIAFEKHLNKLSEQKERLSALINNVNKTIKHLKGEIHMNDNEKFEGFKQKLIDENEQKYGEEIREKYGNESVEKSNSKLRNMSEDEYNDAQKLAQDILTTLGEAFMTGDPAGELAQKAAEMHRRWLCVYWDHYSKEAHAALSQMYVDDERFTAYYDKERPGTAAFLRDAVHIYTGIQKNGD